MAAVLPAAAAPESAGAEPARHSVLGEETLAIYEFTTATLLGLATGFGLIVMLFWRVSPPAVLLPWATAFVSLWFVRIGLSQGFRRAVRQHGEATPWARWLRRWNVLTLASASMWGITGWVFYGHGTGIQQTGLIVLVYTFCVAVIPVLANQPGVFVTYVALCIGPLIVRIAMGGDTYSYQLAGSLFIITSLTTAIARNYRQSLQRVIVLKIRADELLDQLRIEKQAAEDARREAEIANRAKTQFFTAASHDLRQPLHAMGLFAEALRQRTREPEVASLVMSINASVDALEGLFSELLDITRIDSGNIEVHPQGFEMADILRKIRLHFEPTAFEKGLALRLRGGQRVVHGDPMLVERIVRNLVSNAIRYTNDGTVLVACRQRGDKVLVQVWDTGAGIAPEQQARVFEEFYQVPDRPAVSADQRKGLGLGLAIVKRLAALMNAPLTLRSTPGRGSVFTLELPVGVKPKPQALALPGKGPVGITLEGRRIVVVEDEPAVLAGIEVLLSGWGATLVTFDSVGAASDWAARADVRSDRPDLLIVDYRLENGRTGVDAIAALRERFGAGVPAIVVTGSTMTGHDKEAQEKDFHILLKPVVPNKLRAMIAFKLGVKPAAALGS